MKEKKDSQSVGPWANEVLCFNKLLTVWKNVNVLSGEKITGLWSY